MSNKITIHEDYLVVGVVREVKGTNVIVRMLNNMNQIIHFYKGIKYSGVMIGSFIGIKRGQYTIVGKVEKEYAYDQSKDINTQEFSQDRFVREVELSILGSFKNESYIPGIVAFPQVFNNAILLSEQQNSSILKTNIDGPVPPLPFGKLWPDGYRYNLKWEELFNSHIAVFGNTGSGKSNTVAKMYSELLKLKDSNKLDFGRSKFILIDFNGEYIGEDTISKSKDIFNLSTKNNTPSNRLKIPSSQFWDAEMLSIMFGATEQTQQPFIKRVVNFYFKDGFNFKEEIGRYLSYAFRDVYSSPNKNSLDLLKQVIVLLGYENNHVSEWINKTKINTTTGSFYSNEYIEGWERSPYKQEFYFNLEGNILEQMTSEIKERISLPPDDLMSPLKELQIASYFKMIFELRQNTVQYDHISPLLHRIESRVEDFSRVFEIEYSDYQMFDNNVLNIISLKNVNQDMKMIIPMIIAKITYDINKEQNLDKSWIYNLVIDEAHNILSEKSSRETEKWKDYRLEIFEEIIKEGRKFGYYLTIASQRPADISPTIVSQIHNFFIHRLVNENDLKLLERTMSTLDEVSRNNIPNLAPGQVICTGVSFKIPVIVIVDRLVEKDAPNSANPELEKIWLVDYKD